MGKLAGFGRPQKRGVDVQGRGRCGTADGVAFMPERPAGKRPALTEHTQLELRDRREQTEVRVCGHGSSIAAEPLKSAFEAFSRTEGSTPHNFAGSGLALSIAGEAT